jgi:hypothetical protein
MNGLSRTLGLVAATERCERVRKQVEDVNR